MHARGATARGRHELHAPVGVGVGAAGEDEQAVVGASRGVGRAGERDVRCAHADELAVGLAAPIEPTVEDAAAESAAPEGDEVAGRRGGDARVGGFFARGATPEGVGRCRRSAEIAAEVPITSPGASVRAPPMGPPARIDDEEVGARV